MSASETSPLLPLTQIARTSVFASFALSGDGHGQQAQIDELHPMFDRNIDLSSHVERLIADENVLNLHKNIEKNASIAMLAADKMVTDMLLPQKVGVPMRKNSKSAIAASKRELSMGSCPNNPMSPSIASPIDTLSKAQNCAIFGGSCSSPNHNLSSAEMGAMDACTVTEMTSQKTKSCFPSFI